MYKQGRILIEELEDYSDILQDIRNNSYHIKIDELRPNNISRIKSRLSYEDAYNLIKDSGNSLKCYFRDKIVEDAHYNVSYFGSKKNISYFIFYDISVENMMLIKNKYNLKEEWFN